MTSAARASGLFITFEGTEGSGKSTQMKMLVERLRRAGYPVTENQEPGATHIGRQIRRILLDPEHQEMAPMTELLLMFASRTQASFEIVSPALGRGDIVVSDRFTDSTLAYQGEGRGLGFETVQRAHRLALDGLLPDLTVCLTIDLAVGLQRAYQRNKRLESGASEGSEARLDQQGMEFHERVNKGYQKIAELEPERFHFVNAEGDVETVASRVWTKVQPLLNEWVAREKHESR